MIESSDGIVVMVDSTSGILRFVLLTARGAPDLPPVPLNALRVEEVEGPVDAEQSP